MRTTSRLNYGPSRADGPVPERGAELHAARLVRDGEAPLWLRAGELRGRRDRDALSGYLRTRD